MSGGRGVRPGPLAGFISSAQSRLPSRLAGSGGWPGRDGLLAELISAGQALIDEARSSLGIEASSKFLLQPGGEPFGAVVVEATTETGCGLALKTYLVRCSDPRNPLALSIEVACAGYGRRYFESVLASVPGVLADILDYGRGIKFDAALDQELGRGASSFEWIKAYFAEHNLNDFSIRRDLTGDSIDMTVRRAALSLVAIYDAATAAFGPEQDLERLLRHHARLFSRREGRRGGRPHKLRRPN